MHAAVRHGEVVVENVFNQPRFADDGHLPIAPGLTGVPSDAFEEVRAEWLATDPKRTAGERRSDADPVVVSDETAAAIHGIGDLSAGGVHLTASRRLQTRQAWVSVHQRRLTAREFQWIDGLPVTTPRRTLEELAASGRWEHSQLHDLAMDAITQGLIPRSEVALSPILIRALPELAPPVSHASLRQRLANDARERGAEPRASPTRKVYLPAVWPTARTLRSPG